MQASTSRGEMPSGPEGSVAMARLEEALKTVQAHTAFEPTADLLQGSRGAGAGGSSSLARVDSDGGEEEAAAWVGGEKVEGVEGLTITPMGEAAAELIADAAAVVGRRLSQGAAAVSRRLSGSASQVTQGIRRTLTNSRSRNARTVESVAEGNGSAAAAAELKDDTASAAAAHDTGGSGGGDQQQQEGQRGGGLAALAVGVSRKLSQAVQPPSPLVGDAIADQAQEDWTSGPAI